LDFFKYSTKAPSASIFFSTIFIMSLPLPSQKRLWDKSPCINIIALSSDFGKKLDQRNKVRFRHKKGRGEGVSLLPGPEAGSQGFTQIGEEEG
jgi:hypothetical protein